MSDSKKIREDAALWLSREDSGDWSEHDQVLRDQWLATSPAHKVAFLRLQAAWTRTERLAALEPSLRATIKRRPRFVAPLAASLCAFAAGAASVAWLTLPPKGLYQTSIGAHETVRLSDGTALELNTNTRLRAIETASDRQVVLESGEAYFQVVHDPRRPFVVIAGPKRITDIGTKFSVRLDGDRVSVVVTEGRVKIDDVSPSGTGQQAEQPVSVPQNKEALATSAEMLVVDKSPQEIADDLGWRNGIITFRHDELAQVVYEFNRYNTKKLVIDGDKVAHTRIGGRFQAGNIEAFAQLLRDGFGFKVREEDGLIIISE